METMLALINEPGNAKGFIGYVSRLAQDLHMNLHLMYVEEPESYHYSPQTSPNYDISRQALKKTMEEVSEMIGKQITGIKEELNTDISIEFTAEIAATIPAIEKFTSENHPIMLVTESLKDKSFWTQSTDSIDIINNANCPVWVIPHGSEYIPFTKIVYATDYREEDIPTMKNLITLTYWFSPEITALHIGDNADFDERVKKAGFNEVLRSKIGYQNITVKTIVDKSKEDISHIINDYAINTNANLIVVLKENRNFFDRIVNPSATKKIVRDAKLPVLVFKE